MKILVTSSINQDLLAPQMIKSGNELGFELIPTYYLDTLSQFLKKGFFHKVLFRVFPNLIYQSLNKQLLQDVTVHKPDAVWIFKGMEIFPKTLKSIKNKGIKLINYNLDHPLVYYSKASGNSNIYNSIHLYDLHFTYSEAIKRELEDKFPLLNVSYLPFGYPSYVSDLDLEQIQEKIKVCFIGYGDKERFKWIKSLSDNGIEVDLYGPGWDPYLKKNRLKGVVSFSPVNGIKYWETIVKYRVQLNLLRPHNYLSHNMRTFEVPSVGGIMLTQETPEHLEFFSKNSEVFFFKDQESLVHQVNEILGFSKDQSIKIRQNAKYRCESSGYSYNHRINVALQKIKEII